MDRNELPLEARHLGVPSGASKIISKPMVHSAQAVHLSYAETNTISKQTETKLSHDIYYLGVPSDVPKAMLMVDSS
jgi:hypothetical protein